MIIAKNLYASRRLNQNAGFTEDALGINCKKILVGGVVMKFIGNIIWLLIGGIIASIAWFLAGLILCITIIGIPFGLQCFKIAGFVLWPFGREIELGHFGAGGLIANIIWLIVFGWEFANCTFDYWFTSALPSFGIPFGLQHFKLAQLGLIPFGAQIQQKQ